MPRISETGSLPIIGLFVVCATIANMALAASPNPAALAAKIDNHFAVVWANAKITPAPLVDDAGFARRVYLDLVGRIPTAAEARTFVADSDPEKRAILVRQLVNSGAHARHSADFWRRTWVPQSETGEYSRLAEEIEDWLIEQLRLETKYDELATALLTPAESPQQSGPWRLFYSASGYQPENLAASTTRAFLGVNLDCAQCHDHPFALWTQDQFWQTAAFFAKPGEDEGKTKLTIAVAESANVATPRYLTNEEPSWPAEITSSTGPRKLAAWVTAKDNPFFTKNAVNRLWAEYFGTGLIEPLDELSGQTPASHPELLDELSKAFTESDFDLKYLAAALTLTRAYQLESALPKGVEPIESQLFARMPVRSLTGVQLYDSLQIAAGYLPEQASNDSQEAARTRRNFAGRFRTDRSTNAERSVTQSLTLINGKLAMELTDPARAPTLIAVADAPFLDTQGKVETLFFSALGREPAPDELTPLIKFVESGGSHRAPDKALGDVFWALLNSSEFNTNH